MYATIRYAPPRFRTHQPTIPRDVSITPRIISFSSANRNHLCLVTKSVTFPGKFGVTKEGSIQELDEDDAPVSIPLTPINGESQFDRVIAEAQQLDQKVVIVWMASWCRKCIYLKPKLEKLAADYHPSIDVNAVPHSLVKRAGVTKMPTIQLWKDGKKQAEVIGGHKAYVVINEVRGMIETEGEDYI